MRGVIFLSCSSGHIFSNSMLWFNRLQISNIKLLPHHPLRFLHDGMIKTQLQQKRRSLTVAATHQMPRFQACRRAGLVGLSCIAATTPLVAFATPISGSADAPDQSVAKEGEDKQPPGFKYTHMW